MENDSPPQQLRVSLPIGGMEKVVATVTGYSGIERFNLIKLISKAGGNYVGRMNRSITHLVCWKYEGTKFQLARKFSIVIVNHQWIEDCVKAGRRLPEDPYTRQCGHEVGPLKLDASLISVKTRGPNQPNGRKELGELHANQILLNRKKRNSDLPEPSHGGRRRKLVKKNAIEEPLIITSDSEPEITGQEDFHELYLRGAVSDLSDPSDELNAMNVYDSTFSDSGHDRAEGLVSPKRSSAASPESSRSGRRRRLVKRNMTKQNLSRISESTEGSTRLEPSHEPAKRLAVSNHTGPKKDSKLSDLHACGSSHDNYGQNRIDGLNEEKTEDVIDVVAIDDESLQVKGASSEQVNDNLENRNDTEPPTRLPTSVELSCVICWTNFSTTRGVLPCGHRFCFSCIQSWADHMTLSKKTSTCPLCKAAFSSITRVDDAVPSDQKIYSQTVPDDETRMERIHILPGAETPSIPSHSFGAAVCCRCYCREPEDLLQRCNLCCVQCIHTYCLDPPLLPWTCGNCKDLQRLYQHIR